MADKFKGEVVVKSDIEKDRFENAALLCGFCVAVKPLSTGGYKLVFFISGESEK